MSLEGAIKALESVTPAATTQEKTTIEMPVNMANSGANEAPTPPQTSQEIKENGTDSAGVVEAVEAKKEEVEAAPAKKEEPISSKFAALAKKEKAVVKLQQDVKAKEAAIATREAAIAEREAKIKESESLFDTDPFTALEKRGYSYQKLTDMILSGKMTVEKKPEDPIVTAQKIADDLRKEFADKEAARQAADEKAKAESKEQQEAALQAAYDQYRNEVAVFTKENADKYEMINIFDQQELIIETVNGFHEKHGRVLSVQEACDMVEKYLDEEFQKAQKAKKYSKPAETETKKATVEETPKTTTKTLSNNMTPSTGITNPAVTEAERMKRALAALNSDRSR